MSLDRLRSALADRYTIERELGAGGMATVYLAEDLKHKRKVAIKVLREELAAGDSAERFVREVETTANLRHPHIVPLHDSGVADGFPFYVMPLVDGESLRARLDREKQLPIEDALRIAREVADALSYAHAHGVIHRDIKPANVLLESGHAVVTDFGIAKALGLGHGQTLTQAGMAIGTPHYMSPEQAAGESDIDGRSDVYALGCMLYEMLAGRPPFIGPTTESVVRQHLGADAPLISQLRPSVPADVVMAIQRSMAKTPADRFNPVVQFAEALRLPTSAAPVSRARPWRTVALLGGVAALAWFGWRALQPAPFTMSVTNIRQVTREPAAEIHVALSPDGREIAMSRGRHSIPK